MGMDWVVWMGMDGGGDVDAMSRLPTQCARAPRRRFAEWRSGFYTPQVYKVAGLGEPLVGMISGAGGGDDTCSQLVLVGVSSCVVSARVAASRYRSP